MKQGIQIFFFYFKKADLASSDESEHIFKSENP